MESQAGDFSLWELLKAAERSSALFRLYNHREGLATSADSLPTRLFEPLEKGELKGERNRSRRIP